MSIPSVTSSHKNCSYDAPSHIIIPYEINLSYNNGTFHNSCLFLDIDIMLCNMCPVLLEALENAPYLMTGTMTMMPRSTIKRAASPTLRTFSALSSGEKPNPLFRPWRTLSPSRMYACRPCAASFTSNAFDTVL